MAIEQTKTIHCVGCENAKAPYLLTMQYGLHKTYLPAVVSGGECFGRLAENLHQPSGYDEQLVADTETLQIFLDLERRHRLADRSLVGLVQPVMDVSVVIPDQFHRSNRFEPYFYLRYLLHSSFGEIQPNGLFHTIPVFEFEKATSRKVHFQMFPNVKLL